MNHPALQTIAVFFVLALSVTISTPAWAQGQLGRGHQWVRSHPYTIIGLTRMTPQPFNIKQYRGAGFSALLTWEPGTYDVLLPLAAADSLPWHLHLEHWGEEFANKPGDTNTTLVEGLKQLDSQANRDRLHKMLKNPGCIGIMVNDEAVRPSYLRYTRQLLKWLRQQYPDAIAYCNAHPLGHEAQGTGYVNVEQYYDEFAAMIEPDVFMTDLYPLADPDGTSDDYLKLIGAIRNTALEHGMPYWMFIQSFERQGKWTRRLPSESDLRFQMFTLLTYGYTGILYFTYDIAYERGLIEKSGEPNSLHAAATKANPEVANIGAAMRFLTSTDVRYVPGTHQEDGKAVTNNLPRDTKLWTPGAGGDRSIVRITIEPSNEEKNDLRQGKDAMLGLFQDDQGKRHFMITNMWHGAEASAADRTSAITIKFAPEVRKLYRLDRISGKTVPVDLQNGVLRLNLPGGTGDLFKYTAEPFPGTQN